MRLLLLALVVVPCAASAQVPRLVLGGPERVTGDGTTAVVYSLRVQPPASAKLVHSVQLEVEAGTVRDMRDLEPGVYEIDYVPPRVPVAARVSLVVTAAAGGRPLRARTVVVVQPQAETLAEVSSGGALDLRAPARLVLGRDAKAQVSLKRVGAVAPRLVASVGQLSAPVADTSGRWIAQYLAPAARVPQAALIAALAEDGTLLDWLALPLHGLGAVEAHSEAGAAVLVTVGDATWGPVRADDRGRAEVDIVAPPGVRTATTIATDRFGNRVERPLDLAVPPFGQVLALCPDAGDRLLLLAVDESGRPALDPRFELQASRGSLAPAASVTAGLFEALYHVPDDAHVGEKVMLTATLGTGAPVSCAVEVRGGRPAQVALEVGAERWIAGSGVPIEVIVRLLDSAGRPAQTVPVELVPSLGELAPPKPIGQGAYTTRWTLPEHLRGLRRAELAAAASTTPPLRAEAAVALEPGSARKLEVAADHAELRADGASTARLSVRALDAWDNPVPGLHLEGDAAGTLGALASDAAPGAYQGTYTAPLSYDTGADRVRVRVAGADVEGTTAIALTPTRRPYALHPKAGVTTNLGKLTVAYFALEYVARLPVLDDGLVAGFELGYSFSDASDALAGRDEQVESWTWLMPVMLRAGYELPLNELLSLRAGAGAGLLLGLRDTSSPSTGRALQPIHDAAYQLWTGADFAFGPGALSLEVSYLYSYVARGELKGNLGGLAFTGGYRWAFAW